MFAMHGEPANVETRSRAVTLFLDAVLAMGLLGSVGATVSADEDGGVFTKWWNGYKHTFITSAGRVQRLNQQGDTVSEGQAYAMLRSVLADDRATFDKLLAWTDNNLYNNLSRRGRPAGEIAC